MNKLLAIFHVFLAFCLLAYFNLAGFDTLEFLSLVLLLLPFRVAHFFLAYEVGKANHVYLGLYALSLWVIIFVRAFSATWIEYASMWVGTLCIEVVWLAYIISLKAWVGKASGLVLAVFANPKNDLPYLKEEENGISKVFRMPHLARRVHFECRMNTDVKMYFNLLQDYKDKIHIFHYGGHANSETLALQNANALFLPLARELAGRNKDCLKLVFLNGCATFAHVETLFGLGIPAVIATSAHVNDEIACRFAVHFYERLAHTERPDNIQEAYQSARNYVEGTQEKHTAQYWADVKDIGEFRWGLYVNKGIDAEKIRLFS